MKAQKNLNNHRFTKEQEVEIETYYTKLFNENNYGMRVKFNDIYKILSSGKFKNQIETEASGGAFTPTKRKYLSNKWFGTPDNTNPEDYEKYGYLCNSNLIEEFYGDFENKTSIYRNVLVVFKKENVKYRTTFTNGDSLNADFKSRNFSPSYTYNPSFSSETKNLFDYSKNTKLSEHMTNDFVNRYIEIQYHGELTLDDVDYIVFDRNRLHNDIGVETEKLLSKAKFLADKGIKILKICNYSSETNKNKTLRFDKDHIDWREV